MFSVPLFGADKVVQTLVPYQLATSNMWVYIQSTCMQIFMLTVIIYTQVVQEDL